MNDVEPKDGQPISEPGATVPNPANEGKPPGGWQMPEPVFQQTSGYLPEGYIDQLGLGGESGSSAATAKAMAAAPSIEPTAAPKIDVEPQPDLTEQLAEPPVIATPPVVVKQRSAGARIALIVLGLGGMVLFIAAFLAVVYFLFLAPAEGGSQF
jgi:hypothetical protein